MYRNFRFFTKIGTEFFVYPRTGTEPETEELVFQKNRNRTGHLNLCFSKNQTVTLTGTSKIIKLPVSGLNTKPFGLMVFFSAKH